jgi:hypothetical protein
LQRPIDAEQALRRVSFETEVSMGISRTLGLGLLTCLALPAQVSAQIPDPPASVLSPEQRTAMEPRLEFQRTLERLLVPAWSGYLGDERPRYEEGYRAGVAYLSRNLEWSSVSAEEMERLQKGRPLPFRMGFMAACEADLAFQRQRPAQDLEGKAAPVTLHASSKPPVALAWEGSTDEGKARHAYWNAVAAVLVPNWEGFARSPEYGKGFRDGTRYIFAELHAAPTDFGLKRKLREDSGRPADNRVGFMAALETYSAYQAMSPDGRKAEFRPVTLLTADSREIPFEGTYSYDAPDTYPPEELRGSAGKTLLEILGPQNIGRIVAFTNPGVPGLSGPSLDQCRQNLTSFVLAEPISLPILSSTEGFLEMRDGRTLRWTLTAAPMEALIVGNHVFLKPAPARTPAPQEGAPGITTAGSGRSAPSPPRDG